MGKEVEFSESFHVPSYRPRFNPTNKTEVFHHYKGSKTATMGRWMSDTFGDDNAKQLFSHGPRFCFGGYFASPRTAIHRQPIYVYEAMYIQQKYLLEDIDHFIERLWEAVLSEWRPIQCNVTSFKESEGEGELRRSLWNNILENESVSLDERMKLREKFRKTIFKTEKRFVIARK